MTPTKYDPKQQCPDPAKLPVLKRGSKGPHVRLLQEWLDLFGCGTMIDGEFGPATEAALRRFGQTTVGLDDVAQTDVNVWTRLLMPMIYAVTNNLTPTTSFRNAVLSVAHQHLNAKPREVGGENSGPWVRLYMDGNQGQIWAWCAGFATFVVLQAATQAAVATVSAPIARTFDCDVLARTAKASGRFVVGVNGKKPEGVAVGDVFVVKGKTAGDWIHTGVIVDIADDHLTTIEGNTNDTGGREGYMVAKRFRSFTGLDYIRVQ